MAKFPALPLYTDAYLADTRHLTTEEHGAYLLLLICMWRAPGCVLKDDNRLLSRMVGVSARRWVKLRPVLEDFFVISEGRWQQKKLNLVYEAVATKVEKNRASGAKGGRVRAERAKALVRNAQVPALAQCLPEQEASKVGGAEQATKAKPESKETGSSIIDGVRETVLAAAGLIAGIDEEATLADWINSGCDAETDIVPIIKRIKTREENRRGKAPSHLAYYTAAIEEARDKRIAAETEAKARIALVLNQKPFNCENPSHWRAFLGSASSRYRGDYMSQNWAISSRHPLFTPADIGPDPRVKPNRFIPLEIYEEYGPGWHWQKRGE